MPFFFMSETFQVFNFRHGLRPTSSISPVPETQKKKRIKKKRVLGWKCSFGRKKLFELRMIMNLIKTLFIKSEIFSQLSENLRLWRDSQWRELRPLLKILKVKKNPPSSRLKLFETLIKILLIIFFFVILLLCSLLKAAALFVMTVSSLQNIIK